MLHRSQEQLWHRGRNKEVRPNRYHCCPESAPGQSRAICQLEARHPRNQKRSWEGNRACRLGSRPRNDPKPRLCCFQSSLLWLQVQSLRLRSWQIWTWDVGISERRLLSSAPWGKLRPSGKLISCSRHPWSFARSRSPAEVFLSHLFQICIRARISPFHWASSSTRPHSQASREHSRRHSSLCSARTCGLSHQSHRSKWFHWQMWQRPSTLPVLRLSL